MTVSRFGYYGKLPARADFVGRRLPEDFIKPWDAWIQSALAAGEARGGESWRQRFLASPTWRFALPAGICGRAGWTGVLRPSTDAVGRCFPFVLAAELPGAADPPPAANGDLRSDLLVRHHVRHALPMLRRRRRKGA